MKGVRDLSFISLQLFFPVSSYFIYFLFYLFKLKRSKTSLNTVFKSLYFTDFGRGLFSQLQFINWMLRCRKKKSSKPQDILIALKSMKFRGESSGQKYTSKRESLLRWSPCPPYYHSHPQVSKSEERNKISSLIFAA